MRCFGRCYFTNVIQTSFWGLFLLFLILIATLDRVQKLSKKVPAKYGGLEKLQVPGDNDKLVQHWKGKFVEPSGVKTCQPLHFIPDAEKRPVTALVSFPGSGNTWLRHLIQQSTGVLTGSQFVDDTLLSHGFPGEPVFNASVAVVKTHQWKANIREQFQKAVLLIRHPKSAIQALFNLYSEGHTGCASKSVYERDGGQYWRGFFYKNFREWQYMNLDWIKNFKGPLHVVLYDQLRIDLESTLRSLVEFLDLPLNETALQCTLEHSEGQYHREPCNDNHDPFSQITDKEIVEVEKHVFEEIEKYKLKKRFGFLSVAP